MGKVGGLVCTTYLTFVTKYLYFLERQADSGQTAGRRALR